MGIHEDWVGQNQKGPRGLKWNDPERRDLGSLSRCGRDTKFHITEIHSPPRVNDVAKHMGLIPGLSLDSTVNGLDDGEDDPGQDKHGAAFKQSLKPGSGLNVEYSAIYLAR